MGNYCIVVICLCLLLIVNVESKQQTQGKKKKFGSKDEVADAEHIKEHLDGKINVDTSKMTHEQKQFYYFKMYDLDKNNMLDGIELIKAITHHHNGDDGPLLMSEDKLEESVDQVLEQYDLSNDGYIDFGEFADSQKKKKEEREKNEGTK